MEKAVLGLMKFMKSKKVHVYSNYQLIEFYNVSLCITIMFGFLIVVGKELLSKNQAKCYCENKNGPGGKKQENSIICREFDKNKGAVVEGYNTTTNCSYDEFCTGPNIINGSVDPTFSGWKKLCSRGKIWCIVDDYFLSLFK